MPYLGVPHGIIDQVDLSRWLRCVLLGENFASFHRHAIEANGAKDDLVIYTGGQPSLSWQTSMLAMRRKLPPGLPFLHWSDIDWDGLEIFRKMEGLLGTVTPHLMSIELAEEFGVSVVGSSSRGNQFRGSAIEQLADYLGRSDAKHLEQEALVSRRVSGGPSQIVAVSFSPSASSTSLSAGRSPVKLVVGVGFTHFVEHVVGNGGLDQARSDGSPPPRDAKAGISCAPRQVPSAPSLADIAIWCPPSGGIEQ